MSLFNFMLVTGLAFAPTTFAATGDACTQAAKTASIQKYASEERGQSKNFSDISASIHTVIVKGEKYRIYASGALDIDTGTVVYDVTFANGCNSRPSLVKVLDITPRLQALAHSVYGSILTVNGAIKSGKTHYEIDESSLPTAAKGQFESWKNSGYAMTAFAVALKNTWSYAVAAIVNSGYKYAVVVYDTNGNVIDEAFVYPDPSVGDSGITWQNDTFTPPPTNTGDGAGRPEEEFVTPVTNGDVVSESSAKLAKILTRKHYDGVVALSGRGSLGKTIKVGGACQIDIESLDNTGIQIIVDARDSDGTYTYFMAGSRASSMQTVGISDLTTSTEKLKLSALLYSPAHYCKDCDDNQPAAYARTSITITESGDIITTYQYGTDPAQYSECRARL